jgi:hypothetical protein
MKKIPVKKIALIVLGALVLLQFVRPTRNTGTVMGANHISNIVAVPQEVEQLLATACYDCHSNQTTYPWYTNIQPIGLWMGHHVDEGKDELNFSEFASYKKKRQLHKLDEIVEMIDEKEMPLASYTLIHTNAKLTAEQSSLLITWAKTSKMQLQDSSTKVSETH